MTLRFRVPLTVRPVHWNDIRFRQDDVIKWKHFPRYWPFVRGIHRSSVNSHHKSQWRGALVFSLICARINGWVNNSEAGDLRRHRTHYDVTVMVEQISGLYVRFIEKRTRFLESDELLHELAFLAMIRNTCPRDRTYMLGTAVWTVSESGNSTPLLLCLGPRQWKLLCC